MPLWYLRLSSSLELMLFGEQLKESGGISVLEIFHRAVLIGEVSRGPYFIISMVLSSMFVWSTSKATADIFFADCSLITNYV